MTSLQSSTKNNTKIFTGRLCQCANSTAASRSGSDNSSLPTLVAWQASGTYKHVPTVARLQPGMTGYIQRLEGTDEVLWSHGAGCRRRMGE